MKTSAPTTEPRLLTVPEACVRLRVSRWMLYQLINSRQLRTLTIGRRRLVPAADLDAYLARRADAGDAS